MIPRYLRILFWVLLLASVVMAVVLIRLRERAADRLAEQVPTANSTPLSEPIAAPEETVTLLEANDLDGSVAPVTRKLALPQETGARARVLLRQLLADSTAPESKHPLPAKEGVEAGVEEVFFMPLPGQQNPQTQKPIANGQTAVVNLTAAFADNHPSGIEAETLTLLSIIGTLHENFPVVQQVRFLVDGQQRETLAGHADLTRTYLAGDNASHQ
jgi:hypothetical protein